MGCDMCGRNLELFVSLIEGSRLSVCKDCSGHGEVLEKVFKEEVRVVKPRIFRKEIIESVVSDYSSLIRKVREERGLSQKDFGSKLNEKESIVNKLESGGIIPELVLARKIERVFGIKLVEVEEASKIGFSSDSKGLTIGDMIKFKNEKLGKA